MKYGFDNIEMGRRNEALEGIRRGDLAASGRARAR